MIVRLEEATFPYIGNGSVEEHLQCALDMLKEGEKLRKMTEDFFPDDIKRATDLGEDLLEAVDLWNELKGRYGNDPMAALGVRMWRAGCICQGEVKVLGPMLESVDYLIEERGR